MLKPARVGAQRKGPAEASAPGGVGATRTSWYGPASTRARTVTDSCAREIRIVTTWPDQSGTGPVDQSERPMVTTPPSMSTPSECSTPDLIQCLSLIHI